MSGSNDLRELRNGLGADVDLLNLGDTLIKAFTSFEANDCGVIKIDIIIVNRIMNRR